MKSYSDIKPANAELYEGIDRLESAEILNKEIEILGFQGMPSTMSEGREYVIVHFKLDGKEYTSSSGEVVLKQLREVEDQLPIKATITKEAGKRYYTLK